jgi:DNA-binding winged helix-turn-helix (wHTH) protein
MGSTSAGSVRVWFGPFRLDLAGGILEKRGIRVRLAKQPCQILAMLVSRPGEVVSREELRKELWGSDTAVDFEHGLNAAINKLRQALDDSAEKPRYIETLPGRGYRFLANLRAEDGEVHTHELPSTPATCMARGCCTGHRDHFGRGRDYSVPIQTTSTAGFEGERGEIYDSCAGRFCAGTCGRGSGVLNFTGRIPVGVHGGGRRRTKQVMDPDSFGVR